MKRTIPLAVFLFVGVLACDAKPNPREKWRSENPVPAGVGVAQDIITAYKQDMQHMKKQIRDLTQRVDELEAKSASKVDGRAESH